MTHDPQKRHKTRHRGVTYRVRKGGARSYYVYSGGKQHPAVGGQAEALVLQAELRARTSRGQRVTTSKTVFKDIAGEWMAAKRPNIVERTANDYEADLKNRILSKFGHCKPAQITADQIAEYIRELEIDEELSGSRIANILKPLRGSLDLAVRRNLISVNPMSLLTSDERPHVRGREHHVWSPEEIKRVLDEARRLAARPVAQYDYTALLTLAFYTGLRISELLGLRWCDIDLKDGAFAVKHQLTRRGKLSDPKTSAGKRRVSLATAMVALLTKHKLASQFSGDTDFVFASNAGTPLNYRNVAQRGLEPALDAAGLRPADPKITFHDLRHAYASIMIERGITSVELATVMGHRDSRTTERIYIHLFNRAKMEDKVRAAMQSAMEL